ncbi:bactofilin family protein [Paenibacillus abyssi]|uniref:Cell shape determination protein CcmA n=1 Tax=Paenibacillus abyssi TaxID=1340531 RepID=A0A917G4L9_9BACL|nr:polymer-forming cytoskeletal protein [Paenibacillus abyssi]GGG21541.1 hypothetical protein GCM10010916_42810 [Paenibacillus abyssi]
MFKDKMRSITTDTLIGQGTVAEGKIICDAGIRIEGEYRGDIECTSDVIIGECGMARSNITAQDITIAGIVYGDITARGRLTITASGQLHGVLHAQSLIIHEGGTFSGQSQMDKHQPAKNRPLAADTQESKDEAGKKARQAV